MLEVLVEALQGVCVTEVAEVIGMPKSAVDRRLAELAEVSCV